MGSPSGPRFGADMAKIFGDHKAFSASCRREFKRGFLREFKRGLILE
jgi:hypothetical protein